VADAVKEVDGQTQGQPDDQPQPGIEGKGEHLGQTDKRTGQRNPWEARAAEGAVDSGAGFAQHENAETDDGESEQGANRDELAQNPNG